MRDHSIRAEKLVRYVGVYSPDVVYRLSEGAILIYLATISNPQIIPT